MQENMTKKLTSSAATMAGAKTKSISEIFSDIVTLEFLKNSKKRIAVLRLSGVIGKNVGLRGGGLTLENTNKMIENAFSNSKTSAVILVINSPGGSPVQSELIALRIISLSKEKGIPVYSFVEDVAASGGYWLACAGSEIYASKSSILGSIGVISSGFGMVDAIDKIGVERRVYTSGKNKSVLDPFMPAKKEDIDLIKSMQESIHKHFIDYVKSRRSSKLTQEDEILFNGEFWAGEVAHDFGLIDGIDDMYSFIKKKFGDKVKIDYISQKESFFKKRFGISSKSLASEVANEIKLSIKETTAFSKYDLH